MHIKIEQLALLIKLKTSLNLKIDVAYNLRKRYLNFSVINFYKPKDLGIFVKNKQ